jgi:predicted SAM-dependent methyltransferase
MSSIKRLHWGCGDIRPQAWINSDIVKRPGVDVLSDIVTDGLPLESSTIDYISSQHALQQLEIEGILVALREFLRVLKPNGVLRLCLPDFNKAIDAFIAGNQDYFWCWDWDSIDGNFITQIMDFNYTKTPMTYGFVSELVLHVNFQEVHQLKFGHTMSSHQEIVELDNRPNESFYLEAYKGVMP